MAVAYKGNMGIVYGDPPAQCALCQGSFGSVAYDAVHPHDRVWGWFCKTCFTRMGGRLGTGRGQQFDLQPSGSWVKTAG